MCSSQKNNFELPYRMTHQVEKDSWDLAIFESICKVIWNPIYIRLVLDNLSYRCISLFSPLAGFIDQG